MDHWIDVMGVGPWFYFDRVRVDYLRHRRSHPSTVNR